MDQEQSRFFELADDISKSGRWTIINDKIQRLTANPMPGNEWWVELFGKLCFRLFKEYLLLKRDYEAKHKETALLAWRSRNILELSIWCLYCSKSRENARRFFEDAGRDVLGVFDAFIKWGNAMYLDQAWLDHVTTGKKEIHRQASTEGIASLDGPYKKVGDAADEIGFGDHFRVGCRMLSKLAHPTAMEIVADINHARMNDVIFSHGCLCFMGAFNALEEQVLLASQEEGSTWSAGSGNS